MCALMCAVPCSSWARARHVRCASPAAFADNPDLCDVCPLHRLRTSQTCATCVPAVDAVKELSWADSDLCMLSLLQSTCDGESCSPCNLFVTERAARLTPHSGALQIVARTGKLTYEWRGTAHLPALLARLLAAEPAVEHRPRRHGWAGRAAAPGFAGTSSPAGSEPVAGGGEGADHPSSAGSDVITPAATAADVSMLDVNGAAGSAKRGNGCRLVQHSLWRLSILFVRLLLTSQVHHWNSRMEIVLAHTLSFAPLDQDATEQLSLRARTLQHGQGLSARACHAFAVSCMRHMPSCRARAMHPKASCDLGLKSRPSPRLVRGSMHFAVTSTLSHAGAGRGDHLVGPGKHAPGSPLLP